MPLKAQPFRFQSLISPKLRTQEKNSMIHFHSTDIPVVEPKRSSTNHNRIFTLIAYVSQSLGHVLNIVAPLGQIWANYYPLVVVFGEQEEGGVIMPHSTLTFIINALLAFAEIKSQGQPGFPFQTHPRSIRFSVSSVMMYGLASAAESVISAAGFDHTSVYVITARLGRLGALFILVACLAYLFYV